MPCKNYREALIEAAASGVGLSSELAAHLNECPTCAAAFSEETQLFEAIDHGVRSVANAEVPPALLYRVKAAVEETEFVSPRWKHGLVLAAASVAIVAATFAAVHQHSRTNALQTVQVFAVPVRPQAAPPVAPKAVENPAVAASTSLRSDLHRSQPVVRVVAPSDQLDVLVPPEEREAFARYMASVQEKSNGPVVVVVAEPRGPVLTDGMKPLQIAEVVVNPLDPAEEKASESPQEDH